MSARWLTLRVDTGFYLLLDDFPQLLDEEGSEFVAGTSYDGYQLVLELLAAISYRFGVEGGRFRGSVWNNTFPLVVEDHWEHSTVPAIRTYQLESSGFLFFPYTLADVRKVTRCGHSEVSFSVQSVPVIARLSHGREGFGLIGLPRSLDDEVRERLKDTGIPIVDDFTELGDYIDDDGTLTF
jgi:hypothetical protein